MNRDRIFRREQSRDTASTSLRKSNLHQSQQQQQQNYVNPPQPEQNPSYPGYLTPVSKPVAPIINNNNNPGSSYLEPVRKPPFNINNPQLHPGGGYLSPVRGPAVQIDTYGGETDQTSRPPEKDTYTGPSRPSYMNNPSAPGYINDDIINELKQRNSQTMAPSKDGQQDDGHGYLAPRNTSAVSSFNSDRSTTGLLNKSSNSYIPPSLPKFKKFSIDKNISETDV